MANVNDDTAIFDDAVILPERFDSGEESSRFGMVVGKNRVLTAPETLIYKRVARLVKENKKLKNVLEHNNLRLQNHYDDCLKWKNQYQERENLLKTELFDEKKNAEILQKKLDLFNTSLNSSTYTAPNNSLYGDLDELYSQLESLLSPPNHVEEELEELTEDQDYIVIRQVVQDTRDKIDKFKSYPVPDVSMFDDFRSNLLDIKHKFESLQSDKYKQFEETIDAIQDTVRRHSLSPIVMKGGQQISLAQYVELKAKFDMIVTESQQNVLKLDEMNDVANSNKKLLNSLEEEQRKLSEVNVILNEKNEQIKSMEMRMDDKSVEIHLPSKDIERLSTEVDELKKTIKKLENEKQQLTDDLSETTESFNNIEDENTELMDKVDSLEEMVKKMNMQIQTQASEKPISDVKDASEQSPHQDEVIALQTKLDEKEAAIASMGSDIESYQLRLKEMLTQNDELLLSSQKESEDFKKKKEEQDKRVERLRKRESKDSDRIDSLKKENEDMKLHIDNLQQLLQKNTDKPKEVEQLLMQSIQFVNKSDVYVSMDDTTSIDDNTVVGDSTDDETSSLEHDNAAIVKNLEQENELLKKQVSDLESGIGKFKEQLNAQLERTENDIQKLECELNKKDEHVEKLKADLIVKEENIQSLLKEITELEVKNSTEISLESHDDSKYLHLEESLHEHKERLDESTRILNEKTEENDELMQENMILKKDVQHVISEYKVHSQQALTVSHTLEATQRVLEKYKRDYETLWNSYEPEMRKLGEQQQIVDKLTAEILGAKDLIEHDQLEMKTMTKKMQEQEQQLKKLNDELETLPVLKMQVDVYQNDFNAEREAREKQAAELNKHRERINELSNENHHLKEELRMYSNRQLSELQRRHGVHQSQPPQYDYSGSSSPYGNRSMGAPPIDRSSGRRTSGNSSGGGSGNPTLYGRGGENRSDVYANQSADFSEDTEQRNCPKCEKLCPDLDTLQIHLMECLDNENEDAGN